MLTTAIKYTAIADEPEPRSPIERHGYQAPRSSRVFGSIGTVAICALIAAGLLVTLDRIAPAPIASAPLVVSLLPAISPPRREAKTVEKPKPVRQTVTQSAPRVAPIPPPLVSPPPSPAPVSSPPRASVDPEPSVADVAPPSPVVPPPPQSSASHGPDNWEGRVLARLERYRRYPADALHARQQGTAYIRFRIDRSGHVLSSSLDRSSGSAALDAAALETLRRADPLPKIPPGRPDPAELLVPIEFFIQR